MIFVAVASAIY